MLPSSPMSVHRHQGRKVSPGGCLQRRVVEREHAASPGTPGWRPDTRGQTPARGCPIAHNGQWRSLGRVTCVHANLTISGTPTPHVQSPQTFSHNGPHVPVSNLKLRACVGGTGPHRLTAHTLSGLCAPEAPGPRTPRTLCLPWAACDRSSPTSFCPPPHQGLLIPQSRPRTPTTAERPQHLLRSCLTPDLLSPQVS